MTERGKHFKEAPHEQSDLSLNLEKTSKRAIDVTNQSIAKKELVIRNELFLPSLIPALLLIVYGLVVVWSASLYISDASLPKQILGVALGIIFAFFIWRFDYKNISNYTILLFVFDIVLFVLPLVPGLGYSAKGMTGWIRLPLIDLSLQPSEIMKPTTILLIAALGAEYNGEIPSFKDYLRLCMMLFIPFILLLTQDLGSSLIIFVCGAVIIICSGAKKEWVLPTIGLIVLIVLVIVVFSMAPNLPHFLKEYQMKRLTVFIDPSIDPTGDGYNLQQANIAIGSGGIFGKGIGNATQAGQGFLPEAHTDFVFALLSEQFGLIGGIVLLVLYIWLIIATIVLALRIDSPFGKLLLVGVCAMWTFQVLENVGMCMNVMPITGIPLPFISYGPTSMVVHVFVLGLVQSVWKHRIKGV